MKINCPHCGKEIGLRDKVKRHKNKSYHEDCYTAVLEIEQNKIHDGNGKRGRDKLLSYICEWFRISEVPTKIHAQIDKYRSQYNMGYDDIYRTLDFMYRILNLSPAIEYGIGLVPHYDTQAQQFFKEKETINKANAGADLTLNKQSVTISPRKKNRNMMIDMEGDL